MPYKDEYGDFWIMSMTIVFSHKAATAIEKGE
jgi:hypothetical protein